MVTREGRARNERSHAQGRHPGGPCRRLGQAINEWQAQLEALQQLTSALQNLRMQWLLFEDPRVCRAAIDRRCPTT